MEERGERQREAEGNVGGPSDLHTGPSGVKRKGRGFQTGAAGYLEYSQGAYSRAQGLDTDAPGEGEGAFPVPGEGGEEGGLGGGVEVVGVEGEGEGRGEREGEEMMSSLPGRGRGRGRGEGRTSGARRAGAGSRLLQFAFRDAVQKPQGTHSSRASHGTVTAEPLTVTEEPLTVTAPGEGQGREINGGGEWGEAADGMARVTGEDEGEGGEQTREEEAERRGAEGGVGEGSEAGGLRVGDVSGGGLTGGKRKGTIIVSRALARALLPGRTMLSPADKRRRLTSPGVYKMDPSLVDEPRAEAGDGEGEGAGEGGARRGGGGRSVWVRLGPKVPVFPGAAEEEEEEEDDGVGGKWGIIANARSTEYEGLGNAMHTDEEYPAEGYRTQHWADPAGGLPHPSAAKLGIGPMERTGNWNVLNLKQVQNGGLAGDGAGGVPSGGGGGVYARGPAHAQGQGQAVGAYGAKPRLVYVRPGLMESQQGLKSGATAAAAGSGGRPGVKAAAAGAAAKAGTGTGAGSEEAAKAAASIRARLECMQREMQALKEKQRIVEQHKQAQQGKGESKGQGDAAPAAAGMPVQGTKTGVAAGPQQLARPSDSSSPAKAGSPAAGARPAEGSPTEKGSGDRPSTLARTNSASRRTLLVSNVSPYDNYHDYCTVSH